MDEAEDTCGSVDFGDDAGMAYPPPCLTDLAKRRGRRVEASLSL